MSISKRKSNMSKLQSVCDSEVVVCLGTLIDSVVAEMTATCSTPQPQQVKESYKSAVTIEDLRDEVLVEIFGYLNHNKLGEIARKWGVLSKTSFLWKNVDVKFFLPRESQNEAVINFLSMLPSCVKSMSLHFIVPFESFKFEQLKFEEICKMLVEKYAPLKRLSVSGDNLAFHR